MLRTPYDFEDELLEHRRRLRRRRGRWVVLIVLGVLLSPLILEQGIYYASQWAHLRRGQAYVPTPISDAVVNWCQETYRWSLSRVNGQLDRLPWDPWMVIMFGLLLAALMMLQFRRSV